MNAEKNRLLSLTALLIAASLAAPACVADPGEDVDSSVRGKPESDGKLVDGKADAWNSTNNPERFNVEFDYLLTNLPDSGKAEVTPWPDTYWPTYKDSSNQRWQGSDEMSPLEKYDVAFNGWEPPEGFMELRPFNPSNCEAGFDAAYYEQLGPAANYQSKYKGNAEARDGIDNDDDGEVDECGDYDGVETWWGLCHAWVPAAILEKEPQHAVTYNGVTFEVGDIKALLITQYDRASAFMLGGRCNEKEVERDDEGRLTQPQCRDTNAGSFHVVLTNMLGRYKRSFAEDRTYDYEVWNQPMYDYQVLSQEPLDAKAAMAALGQPDAESYTYNEDAVSFVKFRTKVRYLSEPHQSTTRPLVPDVENNGSYLGSDTYDYIVELDADGKIIGGEWMNYSQTSHPDFLWLPIADRGGNPHLAMDKIQILLELATAEEQPGGGEDTLRNFENAQEVAIPYNDENGASSTITIDESMDIGSLKLALEVEHSYRGDLRITLEKDGTVVTLLDREGGGADDIQRSFDVDGFSGQNAQGTWTLRISDHAAWDKGALKKWSLSVSTEAAAAASEFAAEGLPLSIPDDDAAGVASTLSVDADGSIDSLKVNVNLRHTYVGDLTLKLSHDGIVKTLHSREGGSNDDIVKTFTVDGFEGSDLRGEWTLSVVDDAGQDVGTLDAWSLSATTR
jgi:subtilisin-like proprotein convertase family protein